MYGNNIWEDIKWRFKFGSPFLRLIFILISTFALVQILGFIDWISGTRTESFIVENFSLHANLHYLIRHPWGIITYAFLHDGFRHIFWNLTVLYLFGNILEDLLGKPKVLPLFFYGIVFGGLLYVFSYNIFPLLKPEAPFAINLGCSAGVMAIMIAATTLSPSYNIGIFLIGPVRIIWIAGILVFLDFVDMPKGNAGGHIAHLGGALFGYLFVRLLQNGHDLSRPFYAVTDFIAKPFRKKTNLRVEYKKEYAYTSGSTKQTKGNPAQPKETISKQERLDAILDKINRSSYDSLSKEEKDFLFKISQEE